MRRHMFLYGFSIFSMFFGSGNLVYPLMVGVNSCENWLAGFLGFFITGIILPFLGLFVIKLHKGEYSNFFEEAGTVARFLIPLFTLSLLGAFGIIPRCITVAHGGLEFLSEEISLVAFSLIFCLACYIICLNDKLMFTLLGKILTPLLLLFLIILIVTGVLNSSPQGNASELFTKNFKDGFFIGYSTMDLFAAFFFSSLIFKQIETLVEETEGKTILKAALKPSIFGASLLAIIYFGFVYLGAHYANLVQGINGELILPTIANQLLGWNGALIIAVIVILSCLTTAVALNSIYARYLCSFKFIGEGKFPIILAITTTISFAISLLDFDGIAKILEPLLDVSYPGLIMLTIFSIATPKYRFAKKVCFYSSVVLMIIC